MRDFSVNRAFHCLFIRRFFVFNLTLVSMIKCLKTFVPALLEMNGPVYIKTFFLNEGDYAFVRASETKGLRLVLEVSTKSQNKS